MYWHAYPHNRGFHRYQGDEDEDSEEEDDDDDEDQVISVSTTV